MADRRLPESLAEESREHDTLFPDRSFQHEDRKVVYPTSPAESDRVLEQAYQDFCEQRISYDEYTLQKNICFKAKNNDGGGMLGGMPNPLEKLFGKKPLI